jgi:predicted xylose isomerase-like sugar epimerase
MSAKEFEVNGTDYKVVLTDQVIGHVNNLKNLYNAAYEDPESFEDVSSEIIKAVENKAAEIEKELSEKEKPKKKSKSKK